MKLRLTIDGKVYEVDVEVLEDAGQHPGLLRPADSSPRVAPVADPALNKAPSAAPRPAASAGSANEEKVLRSPISGVVVRVPVQVGQTVKANDELVVLEAMKMETVIASQCAGKISKVHAVAGAPVQAQQVLVEFE